MRAALISPKGLFALRSARFGATIHLSRIIATVAAVPGVSSCTVRAFRRFWALLVGELADGFLRLGAWGLPRLDADPSRPENGVLVLDIDGEGWAVASDSRLLDPAFCCCNSADSPAAQNVVWNRPSLRGIAWRRGSFAGFRGAARPHPRAARALHARGR